MNDRPYHPRTFATAAPQAPAVIMGQTGEALTYVDLEESANRLAHLLRERGFGARDHLAILMENSARFFEVVWAAQRCGLYFTAINWHLHPDEVNHVLRDSGARGLITSQHCATTAALLDVRDVGLRLIAGEATTGFESYEEVVSAQPTHPIVDETEGSEMQYSSGTTGVPKGVRKPFAPVPSGAPDSWHVQTAMGLEAVFEIGPETVYLSPGPLYHTAPLVWSMAMQRLGAQVVVMERFEAETCLELIERYRITHAQFVPTMFIRLLKLPSEVRSKYDHSSLQVVLHAAAPCPIDVKHEMLRWWGPIIHEYYAGTENIGASGITPEEWLAHPGSVGRPANPVHILDEDGKEVAPGTVGKVFFEGGDSFEYHNDPEKTASITNEHGWRTLGDIGYVDDEGYLFLTDRESHTIISGGVNIYPQEAENVLTMHPEVLDIAVIGVPDEEMGEQVKAVVVPARPVTDPDRLGADLISYCRSRLAAFKCPRSVDFVDALPRDANGKLYKRRLRERHAPQMQ